MKPSKKITTLKVLGQGLPATKSTPSVPTFDKAAKDFTAFFNKEALFAFGAACRQFRTTHRLVDLLTAGLFSNANGTIADAIRAKDDDQQDWTADYRVFSEANRIDPIELFHGVFRAALPLLPDGPVFLAIDDTVLPKRGKKIPLARWCHNPLCPPWQHPALQWGHPCFHAALLTFGNPTHKPQALTVAFEAVPGLTAGKRKEALEAAAAGTPKPKPKRKKKGTGNQGVAKRKHPTDDDDGRTNRHKRQDAKAPRRRGRPSKEESERRKQEELILRQKYPSAPDVAVATIKRVRGWMDDAGIQDRLLIVVGDGSYTNATVFFDLPGRCVYVGRCRPDAYLHLVGRPKKDGTWMYGAKAQTPQAMASNPDIPHTWVTFVYGGDERPLRFKEVGPVCRSASTRKLKMRLLLLRPKSYRHGVRQKRTSYSHEAFLLTSDFDVAPEVLIQGYLYRWAIEVLHRDMKTGASIGKYQVRCKASVASAHSALAATFALLWICALKKYGAARTAVYPAVSIWQRKNHEQRAKRRMAEGKAEPVIRATTVDVLALLRHGSFSHWSRGLARCACPGNGRAKKCGSRNASRPAFFGFVCRSGPYQSWDGLAGKGLETAKEEGKAPRERGFSYVRPPKKAVPMRT